MSAAVAWKGSAKIKSPHAARGATSGSGSSRTASARPKPNHYARDGARPSGRTATTSRTRGASSARACATAARSVSPASTTGRSPASTCARRGSTCCRSTRWARSTRRCSPTSTRCARCSGKELRDLGRLPYPMVRRRGERGFTPGLVGRGARPGRRPRSGATTPTAFALYLTARGITNEVVLRRARRSTRFLGTNNVDNAARVCHAPSTTALKRTIGVGRDHVLVHRRHRQRPDRAVRRQRRQRAAGVHEVPLPGAQARRQGRRWSTRCASRASTATGCRATSRARCSARRWPTSSSACTPAATSRSSTAC